jgi:protein involved in polysaccharide export with SLBB domain
MTTRLSSILVCLLCLGGLSASAAQKFMAPPPEFFQSNGAGRTSVIAPGDQLSVRFALSPEFNKVVKVREDGKISLDLHQGIQAAGQTPEELQKKLVELYSDELTKPEITVDVDSSANSAIFVTGEVQLPGAKELKGRLTVAMALAESQVNQKTAGTKSVFLIRAAQDGKYNVYKLDASFPAGNARSIEVMPGDVLFVPRKFIVKADDFMEQYVRQILPATPSASTTVLFTPGNPEITNAAASK